MGGKFESYCRSHSHRAQLRPDAVNKSPPAMEGFFDGAFRNQAGLISSGNLRRITVGPYTAYFVILPYDTNAAKIPGTTPQSMPGNPEYWANNAQPHRELTAR